jgi:hypothetical protein
VGVVVVVVPEPEPEPGGVVEPEPEDEPEPEPVVVVVPEPAGDVVEVDVVDDGGDCDGEPVGAVGDVVEETGDVGPDDREVTAGPAGPPLTAGAKPSKAERSAGLFPSMPRAHIPTPAKLWLWASCAPR